MEKTENQKKLLKVLNEIFQLDRSDLDFGIYRIMNSKSKEINEFLENDLLSSVKEAFSINENTSLQAELDEAIKQAEALGVDADSIPKVQELKDKLSATSNSTALENDVFSHLTNFFKRYYKDGDFVSLRRYKKDTYAIPYEGEEVKLHWANSDQYYIKSGEYFRDYTFKVNDKTIHLRISDAETEQNNNKASEDKERRFVILEDTPCEIIDDELYINFEYKSVGKEKQEKLNESAVVKALESITDMEFLTALNTLAPTEKNKKRTIFEKHLKDYTSRNSFDYFIHKDLGEFLSRELDFYIKNEMVYLDDIMDSPIKYEEVMGKVKIFKEVSQKIISFLTQLEELQKKLWEKKKFIIETNYCITLDKIDEEYYEQILACDDQLAEWRELFDVEVKTIEDLRDEPYLVLDTKFFDIKFKYKLISEFDNLDEEIDGVLINSENFGALSFLQERYREQMKMIYIDPPYNTGSDGFLYNDTYQHSSWLSFLYDRLSLGRELMSKDGVIFSSIGDEEYYNLDLLKQQVFGADNRIDTTARISKTASNLGTHFASSIDYLLTFAKKINNLESFTAEVDESLYKKIEKDGPRKGEKYRDDIALYQSSLKDIRPGQKYFIDCPDGSKVIPPCKVLDEIQREGEKRWRWTKPTYLKNKDLLVFKETKTSPLLDENGNQSKWNIYTKSYLSDRQQDGTKPRNFFDGFINRKGADLLKKMGINFAFSKPTELTSYLLKITNNTSTTLDFFAGSGTTGHSVINQNREDNENRKYVLIEMGEYFDAVMKPRIQKVVYTDKWAKGKPSTKNGVSQLFKYFKLESYEDTLNNLNFKRTEEQQKTIEYYSQAKEDYMLNYSLDVESQGSLLNVDAFNTPFDYKLNIATSSVGETKATNIDLVETFNYLLGLVVKRMEMLKSYLVIEGHNLNGEKILIIWRNGQSNEELNEFFTKMDWSVYDREFDTIFINGDNNLDNLKKDEDHFKVKLIEQEFKRLMFNEKDN